MIWEYKEKLAKFIKIFELHQLFIHSLLSQIVSIPPSHILPTCTKTIFIPSVNFYHFPTLSVKIGSIPLFSSSGKHQTYHFVGCHNIAINSLPISFSNDLRCVY